MKGLIFLLLCSPLVAKENTPQISIEMSDTQKKENEILVNGIEATATDRYKTIFKKNFEYYLDKYKNQNLALEKAIYESDIEEYKQSTLILRNVKGNEILKFFKPEGKSEDLAVIVNYFDSIDINNEYMVKGFRELAGALSGLLTKNQIHFLALNLKKTAQSGSLTSNNIQKAILYAIEEREIP